MEIDKLTRLETILPRPRSAKSNRGMIRIVNSKKSGKRIEFLRPLLEELGIKESVQLAFIDEKLVVAKKLPNYAQDLILKKSGTKKVIYSTALVEEIAGKLKLNFDNRVSITLLGIRLEKIQGCIIALVWEKK